MLACLSAAAFLSQCDPPQSSRPIEDSDVAAQLGESARSVRSRDAGGEGEAEGEISDGACQPGVVTISVTGDAIVHRAVSESARAHDGGYAHVLSGLAKALSGEACPSQRLVIANLESPLTEARVDPVNTLPPVLGTSPEFAKALAGAGVDVVNVANNHALDQTHLGLADTVVASKAAGLLVLGAGTSRDEALGPLIVERGGVTIGLVGLTRHVNKGVARGVQDFWTVGRLGDTDAVRAALGRARARCDLVIVAAHWGYDFHARPSADQRRAARELAEAGADLIVGSGPHVVQTVEEIETARGKTIVAYSLGNLISNQGLRHEAGRRAQPGDHPVATNPGARDAVVFNARFGPRGQNGALERVGNLEVVPLWVLNNHLARRRDQTIGRDISVQMLRDLDGATREERRRALARALGSVVHLLVD